MAQPIQRIRMKRPTIYRKPAPRRMEQSVFRTIVEMAYEMEMAGTSERWSDSVVERYRQEFLKRYPNGKGLPVPQVVKTVPTIRKDTSFDAVVYMANHAPELWSMYVRPGTFSIGRDFTDDTDDGGVIKIRGHITLRADILLQNCRYRPTDDVWRSFDCIAEYLEKGDGLLALDWLLKEFRAFLIKWRNMRPDELQTPKSCWRRHVVRGGIK